jgi:PhoPQ-activated pathogenicity-related protein
MYKAYGGWTFAFKDYWELGILGKIDSKEMLKLAEIEDPISYINSYTMPKLIVNAGNDEFFMGDNINYWWDKLSEPKNRLFVQNADHSMATGIPEAVPSISKWINKLYNNENNINIDWQFDNNFIITKTDKIPDKVTLWYARTCNNKRRDFRIINLDNPCTCGFKYDNYCTNLRVLWNKKDISISNNMMWNETIDIDINKWTAFFLEFSYSGLDLTTGINIIPNTFPYEDCYGESCNGILV